MKTLPFLLSLIFLAFIFAPGCGNSEESRNQVLKEVFLYGIPLTSIPDSVLTNDSLVSLNIYETGIRNFEPLAKMHQLKRLVAGHNDMESLDLSICQLKSLRFLDLTLAKMLTSDSPFPLPNCLFTLPELDSLVLLGIHQPVFPKIEEPAKNLKYLNLQKMDLDSIPEGFLNFPDLRYLHLQHNNLKDLPNDITNLTSLDTLRLDFNQFTALPASVGKLKKLVSLSLFHNLSLTELPEMSDMENLKDLDLFWTGFKVVPPQIFQLKQLETINLSECKLDSLPIQFNTLSRLKNVSVASCNLSAINPAVFQGLPLRFLNLSENPISDIPEELLKISTLEFLFVQGTNISQSRLNEIKKNYPHIRMEIP